MSRSELIAERSLSFFVRSFTFAELAPGLVYEVRVTAVYTEGVVGLPSTVLLTTLEEGKYLVILSSEWTLILA